MAAITAAAARRTCRSARSLIAEIDAESPREEENVLGKAAAGGVFRAFPFPLWEKKKKKKRYVARRLPSISQSR